MLTQTSVADTVERLSTTLTLHGIYFLRRPKFEQRRVLRERNEF